MSRGAPRGQNSRVNDLSEESVGCPYCGERISILVDRSHDEQEYVEEEEPHVLGHDWTVEIRLGEVLLTGHWQIQLSATPLDWQWCAREAETAFEKAAVLVGKRVQGWLGTYSEALGGSILLAFGLKLLLPL